jgi:uncharacterized membrane protein YoaK (UPF0700 family)
VNLTVAALTLASGSLDVTAFMRLGGVFASVMRSNLVFVGIAAVKAEGALGKDCAVALVRYIAGVGIATAVAGWGTARAQSMSVVSSSSWAESFWS